LKTKIFDSVVVANGHFEEINRPNLIGENSFPGKVMHSHSFKTKKDEIYKGKRIVFLGSGPSGEDICRDLSSVIE
jgi:cation diffusion facilitator CzcD-associated flavoprotein CzcO